ncbi:hypothetical protein C6341_g1526 [Phytophthora cactorum]|nr:hypothetical protein C6341_g1526 [Phytophthora cactorum]
MAERSFPDDMLSDSYHSDAYHPDSGNSDAYYPNWDHSDLDQSGTSSHDVGGMSDVSSGHTEIIPRQSSNLDSQVRDGHQVEVGEEDDGFVLPDGVEAVPGSRSVNYQGYPYSFYHGETQPDCVPDMRQVPHGPPPTLVNWKYQMLLATEELGSRDVSPTPWEVWQTIRRNHFGRENFGRLETESLCDVKNSPGLKSIQFHFTYYEDEVLRRVFGWANPQLMDRMEQRQCSIFIDATYRCVPTRFYQLAIVMMYDPISELHLPTGLVHGLSYDADN